MSSVALFLFGSDARGDLDEASDIDVLAIYPCEVQEDFRNLVRLTLSGNLGARVALAEYSRARIEEMFQEGHLFAWHLFLEAKRLPIAELEVDCSYSFPSPTPYTAGEGDALRFMTLLRSVSARLAEERIGSEIHEAGLIYLSLRNIAMSLSYSCSPQPDFSRYSPYSLSTALGIRFPCEKLIYDALVKARHSSQRGMPAPSIAVEELKMTVMQCCNWAELALEKFHEKRGR